MPNHPIGPLLFPAWARNMSAGGTGVRFLFWGRDGQKVTAIGEQRHWRLERDDLAKSNAELTRANRQLEEFAYVASHDLKSPLLVVVGFLQLLQRTKGDQLDDDAKMYVAAALRGAGRMEVLIDDLLTYSRLGRIERDSEYIDLRTVADDVLVERAEEIEATNASVSVGDLPTVLGNAVMLRQLFDNLISNALKFHRDDRPPTVTMDGVRLHDEWLVRVIDDGIGIPEPERDTVFTMFCRLRQTDDRPGSGVGLAICHRVVQAHGGRLWVEDGADGGAALCFTLPAQS
jgi:light-regulated signal transduction histidine kinase (bacteriophytochrome)